MYLMKKYFRHKIESLIEIKELIDLEYLDFTGKYSSYDERRKAWKIRDERHNFWEICFVESGSIECMVDDNEIRLDQGDLIFMAPDQFHNFTSRDSNLNRAFVACFTCVSPPSKILKGYRLSLCGDSLAAMKHIINETRGTFVLEGKDDELVAKEKPYLGGRQMILLYLDILFLTVLRTITSEDKRIEFLSSHNFKANLVKILTDYINQKLYDKITLDDVCRCIAYSKSFVCAIFKEQTGETIFAYYNRQKIEEAKRLLAETDYSASMISKKLGFSDPKYFNTLFKKYTAMTPIAYRRS